MFNKSKLELYSRAIQIKDMLEFMDCNDIRLSIENINKAHHKLGEVKFILQGERRKRGPYKRRH